MKHEEMSDISTILVEPGDEKMAVVSWVSNHSKPVVIVIPENVESVFQRPGDFLELKQVMRHRETSIMLVMPGNERLKYWARRQGFPVFSSSEACARMLAQYGPLQAMSPTSGNNSSALKLQAALARADNPQRGHSRKGLSLRGLSAQSPRVTEKLVPSYEQTGEQQNFVDLVHGISAGSSWRSRHDSDALRSPAMYSEPSTDALRVSVGSERSMVSGLSVTLKDKTVLILLALLALGVLGGIGFGYLLSLFPIAM